MPSGAGGSLPGGLNTSEAECRRLAGWEAVGIDGESKADLGRGEAAGGASVVGPGEDSDFLEDREDLTFRKREVIKYVCVIMRERCGCM